MQSPSTIEIPNVALRALLERHDFTGAGSWAAERPVWEVADAIDRMDSVQAVAAFRLLDSERALEVFEELDSNSQEAILDTMRGAEFRDFVNELDPDDRAHLLGELPAAVAQRVLAGLSPSERALTTVLMGYPEGSVGRRMTPQFVMLNNEMTARQAMSHIRAHGVDAETIYTLPVVTGDRRLTGIVELRELVMAPGDMPISTLIETTPPRVHATEPAEIAARLMADSNVLDLPVVDAQDRLVGLLTFDDADELIEAADSEDAARFGGSNPWAGHYMAVSVLQMARSRAGWLVLLLAVSFLTVTVADRFESALEQVAALALFIPLLIGTGGKAGTQASSACVRALAIGEVRPADAARVAFREAATGLMLGAGLGVLAMVAGRLFASAQVAFVVGLSLLLVTLLGALVGGLSPLLAKRFNVDPALVSAPVVTTVVDVLGLVIYFLVATAVLGL